MDAHSWRDRRHPTEAKTSSRFENAQKGRHRAETSSLFILSTDTAALSDWEEMDIAEAAEIDICPAHENGMAHFPAPAQLTICAGTLFTGRA